LGWEYISDWKMKYMQNFDGEISVEEFTLGRARIRWR
jgi:hypothetical protein